MAFNAFPIPTEDATPLLTAISNAVDAAAASAEAAAISAGVLDLSAVTAFRSATSDAVSSGTTFSVSDGALSVVCPSSAYFYADLGVTWDGTADIEITLDATMTSGDINRAVSVVMGPLATRRQYVYTRTGRWAVLDAAGSAVIAWGGGTEATKVDNGLEAALNQLMRISIVLTRSGHAILTAVHASGRSSTFKFDAPPTGMIALGIRGAANCTYHRVGIQPASAGRIAAAYIAANSGPSRYPRRWSTLPDYPVGRALPASGVVTSNGDYNGMPVPGFTCTGAAEIPDGKWKGCVLVGDDGRLTEANQGAQQCAIHMLDAAGGRILRTIIPAVTGSVQGVTYAATGSNKFWSAFPNDDSIRRFDLATMAADGTAITGVTALIGFAPNALAFDETQGASGGLWVAGQSASSPTAAKLIDIATGAVVTTISLGAENVDQFQLVGRKLIYQAGSNGDRARLRVYDLTAGTDAPFCGPLEYCIAPEGFVYDARTGVLRVYNDGGYHNSVTQGPTVNCVMEYLVGQV